VFSVSTKSMVFSHRGQAHDDKAKSLVNVSKRQLESSKKASRASVTHIGPKTSVKLLSVASCRESKAAMTTMVVDQSKNSSPVKAY
jgi:hypothetical protein